MEKDDIGAQIERDLERLEQTSNFTHDIRQKVVVKLVAAVDDIQFRPNEDKSTVTEAKRALTDTLLKALNDVDSQRMNLIKLKQRKQADDNNENELKVIGKTVAEFIKNLNASPTRCSDVKEEEPHQAEAQLDALVAEAQIELLPGELEVSSKTAADIER